MKKNGRLSTSAFQRMKKENRRIVMATAYDFPGARLLDDAGVDVILVGDSLGMVVQGRDTTLPVTLDEMIYHTAMVVRGTKSAMVIADMPFPYCQLGPERVLDAAARMIKETGADAVKLEGGANRAETIRTLVEADIPVMGHCGLRPQSVRLFGGYHIARDEERLHRDLDALVGAGVFGIVLECTGASVARGAVESCPVPVIGIGSGNACDGQVLVFHDFLNYNDLPADEMPRHVRTYANIGAAIKKAAEEYAADVRTGAFPGPDESF